MKCTGKNSPMKRQFIVTRTIRQTEIPELLDNSVTKTTSKWAIPVVLHTIIKTARVVQTQIVNILLLMNFIRRSQWPRGLRRRSTDARLLRSWVRIPPRAWMFVCCECCVLSGRGLCDGLITRSEEPYRLWRVVVCDQETSQARRLKPARGL